jgi:hypothetical protein
VLAGASGTSEDVASAIGADGAILLQGSQYAGLAVEKGYCNEDEIIR